MISTGISHPSSASAIRPAAVILTRGTSAALPPVRPGSQQHGKRL
jgi:hypothetical protein